MAAYSTDSPGQEISVEDQYRELQQDHKRLTGVRDELRQKVMQLMLHNCQRLRQEIEQLEQTMHRLQPPPIDLDAAVGRASERYP